MPVIALQQNLNLVANPASTHGVGSAVCVLPSAETLGARLLRDGVVAPHIMVEALSVHHQRRHHLVDVLLSRGAVDTQTLYASIATHWNVGVIDLATSPPDPRLLESMAHVTCLREGLLPWRELGATTVIVTAYPDEFARHQVWLETLFGPITMAVAPLCAIETALLAQRGTKLARRSESRVAEPESCRKFHANSLRTPVLAALLLIVLIGFISPLGMMFGLTIVALLAMYSFTGLKIAALIALGRDRHHFEPPPLIAHLPIVSAMVALYGESNIAAQLVERLGQLDYPRELLDILLVVEAEDRMTRNALACADLPGWMRVIVVPKGAVQTKPRALNYALDHCRGAIIGVYDAEDAPEPDQIRKVVNRFHQRGPDVACLQGILDYYNPRSNWLARCFTIEYASWFRLFLPGIERLGLAVPLGGTTLFFRRTALESLGGWDAHNVTEDADLGMRIARHGYRTELIDSATMEEANCRAFPWVKQRSRWIKGYMMTWITHMRDPKLLWRQLGAWQFVGFQVMFLGSIMQALLAPLLWSFWIVMLGFEHPLVSAMPPGLFVALYGSFFFTEALNILFGVIGIRRTTHRVNPLWVPTLALYHPLASLAAYKAFWELLTCPFYWDKTSHGHFDFG